MGKGDINHFCRDINRFGEDINRFCADINHIGDYINRFREDINRSPDQTLDEVFFRRCGINLVLRPYEASASSIVVVYI
jgi:hypothetical protein